MILKINKYKEIQENISRKKIKLLDINSEILHIAEEQEISKKWKEKSKLEGELQIAEMSAENLLKEILAEGDAYVAEVSGMVLEINQRASEKHRENLNEFHIALTKALEREKEINTQTSDELAFSEERGAIEFLRNKGISVGYHVLSLERSSKMADIKRKLVNPFSESGI